MNKIKSFYIFVILFGVVFLFAVVNYYSGSNKQESDFMPSYKENTKNSTFVEHLDSLTKIYSNFKYGFSMDFPDNWDINKGVSEHTIVRGELKDSAVSFAINVIELKGDLPKEFTMWNLYDMNQNKFASDIRNSMQKQYNSDIYNLTQEKVFVSNRKSVVTCFSYTIKKVDIEMEMKGFIYSIFIPPYTFTVGMHVPKIYYDNHADRYKYLINNFNFIKTKNN
jgi:hypothetical protein